MAIYTLSRGVAFTVIHLSFQAGLGLRRLFPSGSQSPHNAHSMREEPHRATVSCRSSAKRKLDSKDETQGKALAETGRAVLSQSESGGGVSPVPLAVVGRRKCGRSIIPAPYRDAHTPVNPTARPSSCRPAFSYLPTLVRSKHPNPVTYLTSRGSAPALSWVRT